MRAEQRPTLVVSSIVTRTFGNALAFTAMSGLSAMVFLGGCASQYPRPVAVGNPCERLERGLFSSGEEAQEYAEACRVQQEAAFYESSAEAYDAYVANATAAAYEIVAAGNAQADQEYADAIAAVQRANREHQGPEGAASDLLDAARARAVSPERSRIAVLPIACGKGIARDLCAVTQSRLEDALAQDPNIVLVTRTELSRILKEQEFQLSDFVDERKVVAFGRIVGATHVLRIAMVQVAKDRELYDLTVRMVDVETSELIPIHRKFRP